MIYYSNFDGPGAEPAVWSRIVRVPLNTSTGLQDITVPGLAWTPKAARIIANEMVLGGSVGEMGGCIGATDGTNQWNASIRYKDGASAALTSAWRRGGIGTGTGALVTLLGNTGLVTVGAAFSAFIAGGIRINVTANPAPGAYSLMVELFGGSALQASAGTKTLTTQNNSVTVTTGFQTNLLFVESHQDAFDAGVKLAAILSSGLASYDGTTIRQASSIIRCEDAANPTQTQGETRDNGVATFLSSRYAELASITSTQFNLTSRGASLAAMTVGYLALGFAGNAEAWVGVLDSPTSTGNHDFSGPSFTPDWATFRTTHLTATNTNQTDGNGSAFGISTVTADEEHSNQWRARDNVATILAKNEVDTVAINLSDHTGTATFDATFDSFSSGKTTLNFSAANGTARKWVVGMLTG